MFSFPLWIHHRRRPPVSFVVSSSLSPLDPSLESPGLLRHLLLTFPSRPLIGGAFPFLPDSPGFLYHHVLISPLICFHRHLPSLFLIYFHPLYMFTLASTDLSSSPLANNIIIRWSKSVLLRF
jgi:hypothetical protein